MEDSELDPSSDADLISLNDILSLPVVNISYDYDFQKFCTEIDDLSLEDIFLKISSIANIQNYHFDLRAFWLIDIIAELILKGKKDGLNSENLWGMFGWFVFIFNGIKDQKWTHEHLLKHISSVSIASAQEIKRRGSNISNESVRKETLTWTSLKENSVNSQTKFKKSIPKAGDAMSISSRRKRSKLKEEHIKHISKAKKIIIEYNLEDITIIVEAFYDLFASLFQFKLYQWSFSYVDHVVTLEWPYPIHVPRVLKTHSDKPQPPTTAPEIDTKKTSKSKKGKNSKKDKRKNDTATTNVQEVEEMIEKLNVEEPSNWEVDDKIYMLPLREAKGMGPEFFETLFGEEQEELKSEKSKKSKKGEKKQKVQKKIK